MNRAPRPGAVLRAGIVEAERQMESATAVPGAHPVIPFRGRAVPFPELWRDRVGAESNAVALPLGIVLKHHQAATRLVDLDAERSASRRPTP